MATTTFSSAPDNSTDAKFRTWVGGLSTALTTVGFPKTADTGQINTATVTRPTAVPQWKGYEIRTFNDSLQATVPLFMKIEYGNNDYGLPGIQLTLGKGSSGTGTITDPFTFSYAFQSGTIATTATTYTNHVASMDGSSLGVVMGTAMATSSSFLLIERSRDAAGAPTGDGVVVVFRQAVNTYIQSQIHYASGAEYSPYASTLAVNPPATTSMADGSLNAPVFLTSAFVPGRLWQPRGFACGIAADVGAGGTSFTVPGLGTYITTGSQAAAGHPSASFVACLGWS